VDSILFLGIAVSDNRCPVLIVEMELGKSEEEIQSDVGTEQTRFLCAVELIDGSVEENRNTLVSIPDLIPKRLRNESKDQSSPSSDYLPLLNNLAGTMHRTGFILTDYTTDKRYLYFIFHDLYVRLPETYRFHCHILDMHACTNLQTLVTDPFDIHSLSHYPGSRPQTLAKSLVSLRYTNEFQRGLFSGNR
jgi:hypothetical protein